MVDEARCSHRLTPAFIPDPLSGAGATVGLWGSCWPAQELLGRKKRARSPRENSTERQGSVPQASPRPLRRQPKRFCRDIPAPEPWRASGLSLPFLSGESCRVQMGNPPNGAGQRRPYQIGKEGEPVPFVSQRRTFLKDTSR